MSLTGHAPAIGIVNPDGSVTHIAPHPQVTAQVATSIGTPIKTVTSAGHTVSLAGGTQIVTLSPGSAGSGYSIIQPQQMQTISIDGQEAIYIPASSLTGGQQAIQIGNQIISPSNIVARGTASGGGQNQQQVIQGNVQFAQLGTGQTVAVRQAGTNVLQTIQMPMQQSIPIQIPISTSNGQTVYQTIHLPLQTLQAISAGNVTAQVVPQMSQVQVGGHQLQVTQQSGANAAGANQIKQEPGLESSQSATQTTTTTSNANSAGQTVVANVQLPNGQIGQIVQTMVQQPQQIAWSGNTINLGNLTGESVPSSAGSDPSPLSMQFRDCSPASSSSRSSLRVPALCRV